MNSRILISIWGIMKTFEVHKLVEVIRCSLRNGSLLASLDASHDRKAFISAMRPKIEQLATLCKENNLRMSALHADRLLMLFSPSLSIETVQESMADAISRTVGVVEDELSLGMFLSLDPNEAEAWRRQCAFGEPVSDAFPSTDYELEEGSKCFAVGRYTASIFHLMRVLEIGIAALSKSIGGDPENKSWEQILQGIKTKLEENSKIKPEGWKDIEQFYSETSSHFRNLKNAYRNYTMHVHMTYDRERAEEIFVHVRSVMKLLSERVREIS